MRRAFLVTVLVLAVCTVLSGWTAWWFFMTSYGERVARIAGDEAATPRFTFKEAERFGFPFTLGLRFRDVQAEGYLGDVETRLTSPVVIATARPWAPRTIAFEAPEGLGFATRGRAPGGRVSGEARLGQGDLAPEPVLTMTLQLQDVRARIDGAAPVEAEHGRLVWRRASPEFQEADIAFADITLAEDALFGPTAAVAEARFRLAEPWPASGAPEAIARWRDAGGKVHVTHARIDWGALDLSADGALGLDEAYRLAGGLNLLLREPDKTVDRLTALGQFSAEGAAAAKTVLAVMQLGGGGGARLPLAFADGQASVAGYGVADLAPICDCR